MWSIWYMIHIATNRFIRNKKYGFGVTNMGFVPKQSGSSCSQAETPLKQWRLDGFKHSKIHHPDLSPRLTRIDFRWLAQALGCKQFLGTIPILFL